ncbi:hypothetical protein CDD83_2177 [Cordyceps sp. RAO-2017]|nr:hypothetical protein CDD83_2177 [Cordyceps sp. RAO-2017]
MLAKTMLLTALVGLAAAGEEPSSSKAYETSKPVEPTSKPVEPTSKPVETSEPTGAYDGGANQTVVTTTKVVSQYTTFCPGPTVVTLGDKHYTVEKATTLTVTDCPCTVVEVCG